MTDTPSTTDVEHNPPGYGFKTIFEVLQEQHVEWNIFFSDLPFALVFKKLAQDAAFTARMRGITELVDRAKAGDLPALAWIDPNFSDVPDDPTAASDDHPPGDVCRGQRLMARIYAALASSPAWPKTMLIVFYDEHGGFYDHVLPPGHNNTPGPPDDETALQVYGLRVPALVVSPWVEQGSVSHEVYDHTSVLSTVLRRFCAQDGSIPSMGARTDAAHDLGGMLSAESPQLAPPPSPAVGDCAGTPGAALDPEAFGQVLQKALFGF